MSKRPTVKRTSEAAMAAAIVKLLRSTPGGKLTIADTRHLIPRFVRLTKADRAASASRPSEPVWWTAMRNIRAHHSGRKYGLRVTPTGFALLAKRPAAAEMIGRAAHV